MIVGIGHTMRAGKDTAAQALVRDLGFERRAFADKLREMALIINPLITPVTGAVNVQVGHGRLEWAVRGMGWEQAKVTLPEVRRVLQELGSAGRRVLGQDVWVDACLAGLDPDSKVVIPDVRYSNEAKAIRGMGGLLIKVTRPGASVIDDHESERGLEGYAGWDLEILNTGTIQDLEIEVVKFVRDALRGKR